MNRPRLRVRTLLILVAVVGVGFWAATEGDRRSARYLALATRHESQIVGLHGVDSLSFTYLPMDRAGGNIEGERLALDLWHREMWARYYLASMHPWKPLDPEPTFPVEGRREFDRIRKETGR